MLREGKTGRKEGKITVYQLREWQRARSSPTLTGTWQLQENTVWKLKGMDRPFFQLPSAARTGWRCMVLNPVGNWKTEDTPPFTSAGVLVFHPPELGGVWVSPETPEASPEALYQNTGSQSPWQAACDTAEDW